MNKFARSLFIIYERCVCAQNACVHKSKKTKDLIYFGSLFLSRQLGGERNVVHDSIATEFRIPSHPRANVLFFYAS